MTPSGCAGSRRAAHTERGPDTRPRWKRACTWIRHARDAGVGSSLYAELFDALRDQDLHRAIAGIALPNPASVALHGRFGFTQVARFTEQGRKFGRYWDVAWFERALP